MNDKEEFNSEDEFDDEQQKVRYCKICGAELEPHETADICWNCQASMHSSGMV